MCSSRPMMPGRQAAMAAVIAASQAACAAAASSVGVPTQNVRVMSP